VYIFPAMGLAAVASATRRITNAMMRSAARELATHSPALKDPYASLLPALRDIRQVAARIAVAVGLEAQRQGHAPPLPEEKLRQRVMAAQWTPAYPVYK